MGYPGVAVAPEAGAGNANLGSVPRVSRGRKSSPPKATLRSQLDALFRDAAACAEAARRWSDGPGRLWQAELPPQLAAAAALEHLALHTRLMQVMNWLLDPDHSDVVRALKPLAMDPPQPLPADHPIRQTDGVTVAEASRAIVQRSLALAAAHPADPKDVR